MCVHNLEYPPHLFLTYKLYLPLTTITVPHFTLLLLLPYHTSTHLPIPHPYMYSLHHTTTCTCTTYRYLKEVCNGTFPYKPSPYHSPTTYLQEVRNSTVDESYLDNGDSEGEGGGRGELEEPPQPGPPVARGQSKVEIDREENSQTQHEPVCVWVGGWVGVWVGGWAVSDN